MRNIKLLFWIALVYAQPMDHAQWNSFTQEVGIRYLQESYKAHVTCVLYQTADFFMCKAVSPTFEVIYRVKETPSALVLMDAPHIYSYALKRAQTCSLKKKEDF